MTDEELKYALDVELRRRAPQRDGVASVPRIARLVALAIRVDSLVREGKLRDYSEAARLGRVASARMTQIMNLLNLAPDILEEILFWPASGRLTEHHLRRIACCVDWCEQRRLFRALVEGPRGPVHERVDEPSGFPTP